MGAGFQLGDLRTMVRTFWASWEHGEDVIEAQLARRDQIFNAWEANGRAGPNPDWAAWSALANSGSGSYTRWSDPNGIAHNVLDVIAKNGGAWAAQEMAQPGYYERLAQTSTAYIQAHADYTAATEDDTLGDVVKIAAIAGLALTGAGLAGYGPLAGAFGAEAGAVVATAADAGFVGTTAEAIAATEASIVGGADAFVASLGVEPLAASAGATVASSSATLMPPAVPELDPTFGGLLSETAPGSGIFVNQGNAAAFGASLAPSSAGPLEQLLGKAASAVSAAIPAALKNLLSPEKKEAAAVKQAIPDQADGGLLLLLLAGAAALALANR